MMNKRMVNENGLACDKKISKRHCFEGRKRWKRNERYKRIENEKCEQWNSVVEEEASGWLPLTFMLCVSVAGVVSSVLEEETIKVHMQNGLQERTAGFFALGCGGSREKTKYMMGQTYMIDEMVTLLEIETEEGYFKLHNTLIAVSDEKGNNEIEGVPITWLEIAPDIMWIRSREMAIRILDTYHGEGGRCIPRVTRILKGWGEEKTSDVLRNEIKKFKISAKKKGLYQNIPEEFFKQIGMILVAYEVVKERYEIQIKKKDLVEFIFQNVTVSWYGKIVERCCSDEEEEC